MSRELEQIRAEKLADIDPKQNPERAAFEAWYVTHVFDLVTNPVGSPECGLMWAGWKAALASRDAALTASPQAAPEGESKWLEIPAFLRRDAHEKGWLEQHNGRVREQWDGTLASPQVQGGEECPVCHKAWGEHRSGYSASRCKMKPSAATPQRAPGVDGLPAKWRELAEVDRRWNNDFAAARLIGCANELEAALASGPSGVDGEAIYTAEEVAEAMEVLRGRHGSTALVDEVLDEMERVLLAAAPAAQDQGEGNG